MKYEVPLYGVDGSQKGSVALPDVFRESVRDDLIVRAFLAEQSEKLQPKGVFYRAGLQTTARYVGRKEAYHSLKNRGGARLPREMYPKGRIGRVRVVPFAVKGRRAHPPHPEKVLVERINKREKVKALRCAIAATAVAELVKRRHRIPEKIKLPIIFDSAIENITKTKDVMKVLKSLINEDLRRAYNGRSPRGKRKKGTKTPRSALLVCSGDVPLMKAARNIVGFDVATVDSLNVSLLAPGGQAGRLTIWTEAAIDKLNKQTETIKNEAMKAKQ
jgi:large subunit ribosomal protein L4e